MLIRVRNLLLNARQVRGPAIEKWEGIERCAFLLLILTAAVHAGLIFTDHFHRSLAVLGGLVGLFVVGAYAAVFAARLSFAAGLAMLAALVGAATAAGHAAFPLWVLLSNALNTLVLVVSVVAVWTRKQY